MNIIGSDGMWSHFINILGELEYIPGQECGVKWNNSLGNHISTDELRGTEATGFFVRR